MQYLIQNAPFYIYVKYKIDKELDLNAVNIASIQNSTIDGNPAVKIHGALQNVTINDDDWTEITMYLVMHDEEPYTLTYMANVKDYQKFLPEFEQMVKTFNFIK